MRNNIKLTTILLLVTITLTGCGQNIRQPQISDKSSEPEKVEKSQNNKELAG